MGLLVQLSGSRRTRQSDGDDQTWHWDAESAGNNAPHLRWLLRSDGVVQPLLAAAETRTQISEKSGRFAALVEDDVGAREGQSRKERLGYYVLKLGEEHR